MIHWLRQIFSKQEINTPEARVDLNILQTVVVVALVGSLSTLAAVVLFGSSAEVFALVLLLNILQVAAMILLRMRILLPARVIAPVSLYITVTFLLLTGSGLHDTSLIAYGGIIIVSSLILGRRAVFTTAFLIVITVFGIWWLESTKGIVTDASFLTTTDDPFLISIVVLAMAFSQAALISRMNLGLQTARANEKAQIESNRNLREFQASLEQRISERTIELEQQTKDIEERARQFEAIAGVARTVSRTKNLSETLPQIADTISELFGFYHVGIFLTDASNQYAILGAANSEGGKRMLSRGHQLRIGEQGIVGYVTGTGNPRIALDVGADAAYFDNPDLPDTRSEMALPLRIEKRIIGALDVQSTEQNAFSNEDIEILAALADQVSLAIENSRLFEQTQAALAEAEVISRTTLRESWSRLPDEQELFGYKYSIAGTTPLRAREFPGIETRQGNEVAVPITLRGEAIGTLTVHVPPNERISADHVDLIKAVAERVAISAENARLFNESQKRAERERLITDITSRIGSSVRTENILKTTAKELNQLLDGAEVLIKLNREK